jgi:hypothetical protein
MHGYSVPSTMTIYEHQHMYQYLGTHTRGTHAQVACYDLLVHDLLVHDLLVHDLLVHDFVVYDWAMLVKRGERRP